MSRHIVPYQRGIGPGVGAPSINLLKAGLDNICHLGKFPDFLLSGRYTKYVLRVLAQLAIDLRGENIRKVPFQAIWTYERPGDQVGSAVTMNIWRKYLCTYLRKILVFEYLISQINDLSL